MLLKRYTANFYPMKTTGTGNCEVPAAKIAGKHRDDYRSYNHHGVSLQFLQPFSIDSGGFPCRDLAIPSPRGFHGVKICSVHPLNSCSLQCYCSRETRYVSKSVSDDIIAFSFIALSRKRNFNWWFFPKILPQCVRGNRNTNRMAN